MLGSGTSTGVPVVGCDCAVCRSGDPRNKRTRPSVLLEMARGNVLIDTPPDLREQALRVGLARVDAVLFTHAHADHIFGLDDLRPFNFRQGGAIPCYGAAETLARIRQVFSYAFETSQEGGGKPQIELHPVRAPFALLGEEYVPVPAWHGELEVFGYRRGSFAYLTDVHRIPEESWPLLTGLDVLVLSALRYRRHPTHFSLEEAVEAARRIGARRTIFTHLAHDVDHAALATPLPPGIELGYDGLVVGID